MRKLFGAIAAALCAASVLAADPASAAGGFQKPPEAALKEPQDRARKAMQNPDNSFEEPVDDLNGTFARVYYAYFPDQYHDGVNWLQMTIVFPLEGYWDGYGLLSGTEVTKGPDTYSDHAADYEGYDSDDDFVHYEVFMSPTPEPDSPAGEEG